MKKTTKKKKVKKTMYGAFGQVSKNLYMCFENKEEAEGYNRGYLLLEVKKIEITYDL